MCCLLISKDIIFFQVLVDYLSLSKFEKFLDFIESVGEKISPIQRDRDIKGRTLLHILAKKTKEQNIVRAIEIFRILVKEYKIDVTATDKNKRNILHYAGSSRAKFLAFYNEISPDQRQKLLEQKENKL